MVLKYVFRKLNVDIFLFLEISLSSQNFIVVISVQKGEDPKNLNNWVKDAHQNLAQYIAT